MEFTGSITEEEKGELLSSAWMLVHTASHEGWGMVVLEAGMVQTPTLAFEVAGLRDTRPPRRHRPPRPEPGRTRRCLARSPPIPRGVARLGAAARDWALGFTWDRTVDRLEGVLLRAADAAPVPALLPAAAAA